MIKSITGPKRTCS